MLYNNYHLHLLVLRARITTSCI